jgi:hypothetical protein
MREEQLLKNLNIYVLVWNFIKLTRIPFLLGGFWLYALGAAAAVRMGAAIHWDAYRLG